MQFDELILMVVSLLLTPKSQNMYNAQYLFLMYSGTITTPSRGVWLGRNNEHILIFP